MQCRWLSTRRCTALAYRCVFNSALWLAEMWNPTKAQDNLLGVKRRESEDIGQFWRSLHSCAPSTIRLQKVHRDVGHLARLPSSIVSVALRTSCLAWWRYHQARYVSKWDGLHPKRFNPSRWKSRLALYHGEIEYDDTSQNVGWMLAANDRESWGAGEALFLSR